MTAKQMFEKLGWYLYANNSTYICYTKNEDGKRIKFKLRKNKVTLHTDVNWELLKAITKQFEELGWIGDNSVVRCKDCIYNVANMEKDPLDITDYTDIVCSYFMTDGMEPYDFCSKGELCESNISD